MKAVASRQIKGIQADIELQEIKAKPKNGFKFSGFDSLGRPLKGNVPFDSADESRLRLTSAGIFVTNLNPVSNLLKRKRNSRPSVMEMAQLAEQFAAQYEIGLTYDRICRILARVHPNEAIQTALNECADKIVFGQTAHEAFETQMDNKGKPFFPQTFVKAIRIGYDVGALPDPETDLSADAPVVMLRFFAQSQRKAAEIFSKIKSALIYPAGVFASVFVAFFIEVYWLVPIFAQLFIGLLQGKDASLPFATQLMLDISAFFQSPLGWGITLAIFITAGCSVYYFFFNQTGIEKRERLILRLPLFKKFFIPYYGSVFCRDLSMMWESEPDLKKRFTTVGETSSNPVFREMSEHIANQVSEGTSISQLFNGHYLLLGESFAPVAETIENAPGSGAKQLFTYAKFLEQESETQLAFAIAVLDKVAFALAAGMVIFILIASYSPMIELVGKMSSK